MEAAERPIRLDDFPIPDEAATVSSGSRSGKHSLAGFAQSTVGRFLLVLLVVFIAKQALTVLVFPPFSGHDEVAHFNYVETVATDHRVPTLFRCPTDRGQHCLDSSGRLTNTEFSTWKGDILPAYYYRYCQFILDWSPCEPENPRWLDDPFRAANWGFIGQFPAGTQYAANHPPLYYALLAPFARAGASLSPESMQYLLRALAIPFGLAIILLAFLTTRQLFPNDRFLLMTVPAFVAFQPQVSYESAMVNNDIAGIAFVSLVIYLLARGIRHGFDYVTCAWVGAALGLALLTKSNSIFIIPAIALAIALTCGLSNVKEWIPKGIVAAAVGGVLVLPWYLFFYRTYGNLDAFEQIRTLQSPWNKPGGTFTGMLFDRAFVWMRWKETWGEFGWRRIHLDSSFLWSIAAPIVAGLIGLAMFALLSAWKWRDGRDSGPLGFEMPDRAQAIGMLTFLVAVVTAYLAVVQFGTEFALTQARYFFPIVNAFAILVLVGGRTLLPVRLQPIGRALIVCGLVFMNLIIYTRNVIPYWHIIQN
ncbi:MAG TPA: glycosyltransferase family 39 protein [Thermomicrobiales bacterium]|nr:glycosyltransferase family 39 protein [Thermomicrobiales bacterium]